MPERPVEELFATYKEWTKRKHEILRQYIVPATPKLLSKSGGKGVAFVDGYAGANMYEDEAVGSTIEFAIAAEVVRSRGGRGTVYACETDATNYDVLCSALAEPIRIGLVVPYNSTFEDTTPELLARCGDLPAIVFLDPQRPSEMPLDTCVRPWMSRPSTDVLGIFFATNTARICAAAAKTADGSSQRRTAQDSLGSRWREASTDDLALKIFTEAIGGLKSYFGTYALKEVDSRRDVYYVFGASDSHHGY